MSSFTLAWHFLIFGVLPYVVIAVLILGSLARFVLAPFSWKSQSSEILDKKDIFWGANLFHIGVIFLFCGHCFGLFTPTEWLNAAGLTPRLHQMMEIICGGLSAIVAITGLIILTWRRLTNERVRAASRPSDFWVLFLLLAVIILGIGCVVNSYLYDKSGATIILLGGWVRGLFSFDYQAWQNILLVPDWQKAHIFVGLIIFLIVPFTRLVHIWSGYLSVFYLIRPHQIMRANNGKPMK